MKKFKLEIVTPERVFLSEEVESLVVPSQDGYLGVMADHAPLLCLLKPGEVAVKNGGERVYALSSGFMQVASNRVIVLADAIEAPEEIDVARAERARQRAKAADVEELERAKNRIRVAQKRKK